MELCTFTVYSERCKSEVVDVLAMSQISHGGARGLYSLVPPLQNSDKQILKDYDVLHDAQKSYRNTYVVSGQSAWISGFEFISHT